MRIKVFNVIEDEIPFIENWAKEHHIDISITTDGLSCDNIHELRDFDGISCANVAPLVPAIYERLQDLGIKQIAQRSAGVDMYDKTLASQHDIIITNVPSYSPESIAEFSVTIALNLIRKIPVITENVKQQDFRWSSDLRGRVLGDMTVAIIGTGRIGQAAARFFKGFGCQVLGYDLFPNTDLETEGLLTYVSTLEEAISQSDVISLHMPATEDNYHLFDYKLFKQFKNDAILLNMGRGSLVATQDLLQALDDNLLAGAGIDTYETEGGYVMHSWKGKTIEDDTFYRLINHPKVIYSPHIAYYTDEARKNIVEGALNAVLDILKTGTTANRVN